MMSNARAKDEILGKTAIGVIDDWVKDQIFGRRQKFSNKFTQKGTIQEDVAIELAAEFFG